MWPDPERRGPLLPELGTGCRESRTEAGRRRRLGCCPSPQPSHRIRSDGAGDRERDSEK